MIEDFIKHAKAVAYVLQARNMKELLSFMQVAFKQIFKCFKVNFLFQDKETIELLGKEGAVFRQIMHCHEKFEIYVPEDVRKEKFYFIPKFTNIADIKKGQMYQG